MKSLYNSRYPSISDLRLRAKSRIPRFAFEYLDGGCNEDINLNKNRSDLQAIELEPYYLRQFGGLDMSCELFGRKYSAPFGIAPIGLQGLIWPNSPKILAQAAVNHNVPFILSTVTTSSIEEIAEITNGNFWFQLYHPAKDKLRDDILQRTSDAGCPVLVILSDVPTFGFRPRDIRNGLAMPPRMTVHNFLRIIKRPSWALRTLYYGRPNFATLEPYMTKDLNLKQLAKFMDETFDGRLNEKRIAEIRDKWKGKLVIKGLVSEPDVEVAVKHGVDGIIVSNHGGRQLDVGQSSIVPMKKLSNKFDDKINLMVDSGLRSGPDIARAMAAGAKFTFMGRSFMYAVAALGTNGGDHIINLLKTQLRQVMEQLGCESALAFKDHLVKPEET